MEGGGRTMGGETFGAPGVPLGALVLGVVPAPVPSWMVGLPPAATVAFDGMSVRRRGVVSVAAAVAFPATPPIPAPPPPTTTGEFGIERLVLFIVA